MEKIKIAIVDTGVDVKDKYIKEYVKFNKSIQLEGITGYRDLDDLHGHGTLCTKTILSICNNIDNIEIYPVKVFNERGTTSSESLLKSLKNILSSDIDIINISAATLNNKYKNDLENICDKLHERGKIIISSHHKKAKNTDSIPTVFKSVIGVIGSDNIYSDNDYIYRKDKKVQMTANTKECFIKFRNEVTHFGKSSRASAVVTGIICNIFETYGKLVLEELEDVLVKNSMCSIIQVEGIGFNKYKSTPYRLEIAKQILGVIKKKFAVRDIDLDFLDMYSTFNNFTNIGNHNAFDLLTEINREFGIDIDFERLFLYELEDLNKLVDLVYNYLQISDSNNLGK